MLNGSNNNDNNSEGTFKIQVETYLTTNIRAWIFKDF
jgi:hypothetical protein